MKKYRIMWHAVKTKATGYGTGRFTRAECKRIIKDMKEDQTENLIYWTIEELDD